VVIPFLFKTDKTTVITIEDPHGAQVVNQELTPEDRVVAYDFKLPGDSATGDYRIEFKSDLLTTLWPPRAAQYTHVVLERPDQVMSGVRVFFAPRTSREGQSVKVRLMTNLRPHEFQTHRVYRPDGTVALAQTLQLGPPYSKGDTYTIGEVIAESKDQDKVWIYTRMAYGQGWIEGNVYPVIALGPDEFFVPKRFVTKGTDQQ